MSKQIPFGPAFFVTAAFIGPGTVFTASLAGAHFGYALIWALIFSICATLVLQEMAVRLGIVTGKGLGENLRESIHNIWLRRMMLSLVFCAIIIGNAAYQGGNISGASIGLKGLLPANISQANDALLPLVITALAFALLWTGSYRLIERALMILVGLMSIAFIVTFCMTTSDYFSLLKGVYQFHMPKDATLTAIALIGTTVVPYNLFLHASSVSQKWHSVKDLPSAKNDLYVSIPIGGLISIAILSTSAAAFFGHNIAIESSADIAPALEPLLGQWAKSFMALGLFAAGISSAITAPLAAGFALSGIFNFSPNLQSTHFKLICIVILLLGGLTTTLDYRPIHIITFAQVANGFLLPIISCYLLWIMNQAQLGTYKNSIIQNLLGTVIVLITLLIGLRTVGTVFGWFN